jgi:hypothetical protein
VRTFATFTVDLERLAAWLRACQVKTVAMESTGVYWRGRGPAGSCRRLCFSDRWCVADLRAHRNLGAARCAPTCASTSFFQLSPKPSPSNGIIETKASRTGG